VNDKEKRFVDELLEASLRNYAGAGPRPGLEGRVLVGVRARQATARRRTSWAWAASVAAMTAMVMLTMIHHPRRQPAPSPMTAAAPPNSPAPAFDKVAPPVAPHIARQRRPAVPGWVDTRPQQFPTPRPLSEQEKLLLLYAQSLKGSSTDSVPDAEQDPEHELEIPRLSIAAIKIDPLPPPETAGDEQ